MQAPQPGKPQPSIGRVVHYVSYGTPKGEYGSKCCAAIITQVNDANENVGLSIHNPTGLFFNTNVAHDEEQAPGTWHWCEYVPPKE
jgi:hypothetical protein